MKRTIFSILWMVAFFAVGLTISCILLMKFPPSPLPTPEEYNQTELAIRVGVSFCIGLPIVALMLGILGKLPGTRRRKRDEIVA
jgi:hypothetical protein